jgi:hypothetical protein
MSKQALEALDTDGALQESIETVAPTRAGFLARAAVAAGGLVGGGAVLAALPAVAGAVGSVDKQILNFALTLEYLESAFYADAIKHAGLSKADLHFARTVHEHEAAHVAALRKALGSQAIKRPKFDFGAAVQSRSAFLNTSATLEETGVAAYKGQAPRIQDADVLVSAVGIHTVEARHAAWMRRLVGVQPAARAFDRPRAREGVLDVVASTHFVVDRRPATSGASSPRFTG